MNKYEYIMTVTAESREQADIVAANRLCHDEDLREAGVEDYEVGYLPLMSRSEPTAARVLQMIGDLEREVDKLHAAAPEVVTVPAVDGEEEHLLCPSCGERPDEWFELDFDYRVNSAQDEEGACRVYQGDPCHETLAFACGDCDALVRIPDGHVTWN